MDWNECDPLARKLDGSELTECDPLARKLDWTGLNVTRRRGNWTGLDWTECYPLARKLDWTGLTELDPPARKLDLSCIHLSEPTKTERDSYAVFRLKKQKR